MGETDHNFTHIYDVWSDVLLLNKKATLNMQAVKIL